MEEVLVKKLEVQASSGLSPPDGFIQKLSSSKHIDYKSHLEPVMVKAAAKKASPAGKPANVQNGKASLAFKYFQVFQNMYLAL